MQADYPRALKDTPCFAAITHVAPGERFNATPAFALAIVFNGGRPASTRATNYFYLLHFDSFLRTGLVAQQGRLAIRRSSSVI
jgi:hypothetical protein